MLPGITRIYIYIYIYILFLPCDVFFSSPETEPAYRRQVFFGNRDELMRYNNSKLFEGGKRRTLEGCMRPQPLSPEITTKKQIQNERSRGRGLPRAI